MYCFIYRILQIKTVAQCMNNMSLLNVVVINSVFMMSIDKHVHFEMGIASAQMHKKQKQSYIYIVFFSSRAGYICRELYQIDTARLSHTCTKRTACQSDDTRKMQKSKL